MGELHQHIGPLHRSGMERAVHPQAWDYRSGHFQPCGVHRSSHPVLWDQPTLLPDPPLNWGRLVKMFLAASILYGASQFIHFSSPYLTFLFRVLFVLPFPAFLYVFGFYSTKEKQILFKAIQNPFKILGALSLRTSNT